MDKLGPSLLSNKNENERRKRLANFVKVLSESFEKWKLVFPTHEVSKAQLAVYLEALNGLTLSELEIGCREVIKTAQSFPKPSEIITAAKAVGDEPLSGPKLLAYAETTQEEREAAIAECEEATNKLKAWLGSPAVIKSPPTGNKITTASTLPLAEQKKILEKKGLLGPSVTHNPKCLCPDCRKRRERTT